MPIFVLGLVVVLFLIFLWLIGIFYSSLFGNENENPIFMGLFIYFALFQVLALPLILNLKPLSYLTKSWSLLVMVCCLCMIVIGVQRRIIPNRLRHIKQTVCSFSDWLSIGAMGVLLLVFLYFVLIQDLTGWDTAFYIPTVNQSLLTDTMYIYYGASGNKDIMLNLRYAISSFYMHDAVLGQFFHIHGAVVVRYFNSIICVLFSALTVFQIGKLIYNNRNAYYLVIFWIILNFGTSTIYEPNSFLLYRAYEAKALCCNVIIPAVIYQVMLIFMGPENKANWINLFIINLASVAISASSLLIIPVLNACMFIAFFIFNRKIRYGCRMVFCLIPNFIYLCIFYLYQTGIYRIYLI